METAQFKNVFFSSIFCFQFLERNDQTKKQLNDTIRMICSIQYALFGVVDATDSYFCLTSNCNCVQRYCLPLPPFFLLLLLLCLIRSPRITLNLPAFNRIYQSLLNIWLLTVEARTAAIIIILYTVHTDPNERGFSVLRLVTRWILTESLCGSRERMRQFDSLNLYNSTGAGECVYYGCVDVDSTVGRFELNRAGFKGGPDPIVGV